MFVNAESFSILSKSSTRGWKGSSQCSLRWKGSSPCSPRREVSSPRQEGSSPRREGSSLCSPRRKRSFLCSLGWNSFLLFIYTHSFGGVHLLLPLLSFSQISFFIMCPGNFISLFLIVNISVFVVRIFRKTSLLLTCSLYVNLRIRDANYILKKEDKTNQEIYRFYSENVNFIVLTPVHCDILCWF